MVALLFPNCTDSSAQRPTSIVFEATKGTDAATLVRLAGKGSELHRRHKVYLDIVTVATVPEHYESRLLDLFPDRFQNLWLKAFERHDLVLAKLERNIDRDREDLRRLAEGPGLDVDVLRDRYTTELRPSLGRPDRDDLTLQLWVEIIQEVQARHHFDGTALIREDPDKR